MGVIYGTSSLLDDTRNQLVTELTNLQTAMTGNTVPAIAAIYSQHNEVIKLFNAVSVDLDTYQATPSGLDDGIITRYIMIFSIRVHTDYQGGVTDSVQSTQLIDSIKGWLSTHKVFDATTNYRIDTTDVGANLEFFEESFTVGSEMQITITRTESHVQV